MRASDRLQLDRCKGFQSLAPDVRERLSRAGTIRILSRGTTLWRRGTTATSTFVVLSGRIGVFDVSLDDRVAVIDVFGPGSIIAGGATLTDAPYLFSAKALDDSRLYVIPVAAYRRYIRQYHSLALMTALNLAERWRRLVIQLRDMKQLSANQRLGFYLLAQTDRRTGPATVCLGDDQTLVAGLLGVTRQSLSRSFAQLRRHGVGKRGRTVTIKDVGDLRRFCTQPTGR